ncbi:uncharacterized protein TNCV_4973421 [Trichonephila clavipes]|uniref:Uncharacterized protein n=1 Tax=Trichonephila clavipes TaxID=2585209 RepID=A0A8X6VB67_TRICX|nr:uncharacterized protein TNCV_4973421 [Trichonephila clavipes]
MLLDVSMCPRSVVQRLWDQYQSEDSVSRRPVPGRPRATTPAEDRLHQLFRHEGEEHSCAAARCRPLSASGRRISATVQIVFTMQVAVCKKTSCVRSSTTTAKEPLMLGKRTCFLDAATMGFCAVHRRVQIYNEVIQASTDLEEQRTRYHQSNTVKDTAIEVVESWFGQGSRLVATLTCMCSKE